MIRLSCTNCHTTMELDDAFAGGVCRCQQCGTIQTVPSATSGAPGGKATGAPHAKSGSATKSKSLYQGRPGRRSDDARGGRGGSRDAPSSGLDELADAVVSSGITSSGLPGVRGNGRANRSDRRAGRSSTPSIPSAQPAPIDYQTPRPKKSATTALLTTGVVLLALVAAGMGYVLLGRASSQPAAPPRPMPAPVTIRGNPDATTVTGPRFVNVPLTASRVVYVLDRGDASKALFDPLKNALYRSLESLGPEKQFQVVFWRRSTDPSLEDGSFPVAGVAKATPDQIEACRKKFEDLTASGATEIDEAIRVAMARRPGEIVIATAKGNLVDETLLSAVEQARGSFNVKVHTLALASTGGSKVLQAVAEKTGGTYTEVSEQELKAQ